ncbi:MAG TPA: hypothetical protein VGC07_09180 [Granulicella sp.]
MTWQSFFNTSTMASRHLLAVYAIVILVQAGYFGWTVWQWQSLKDRD